MIKRVYLSKKKKRAQKKGASVISNKKGLQGMYLTGENVESMVLDYSSIFDTLDQQKMLPDNSIQDSIQGLSLASHVNFLKMSTDYVSNLKKPLLQRKMLPRLVHKQISAVLETTLTEYALYSLSTATVHGCRSLPVPKKAPSLTADSSVIFASVHIL